ncbi:hypothetical protein L0Z72_06040 [candidate division KSB1 bacterium]|nr:hypothetical protein [candidate division KSB1 bacterium]
MKVKFDTLIWDRIDEDRWITASIATLIFLVLTLLIFNSIHIPENINKVTFTEDMDFVKLEKENERIQESRTEEKLSQESDMAQEEKLPRDYNISNKFNNPSDNPDQKVVLTAPIDPPVEDDALVPSANIPMPNESALLLPDIETYAPPEQLDNKGIADKIPMVNILPRDKKSPDYNGDGINPKTAKAAKRNVKVFPDNSPNFIWEPLREPIFDWIRKNAGPIGIVPTVFLTDKDQAARTAKTFFYFENVKYELFLVSKEEKRELIICLVNLETQEFVKLMDVGLIQSSNVYTTGIVRRQENEIFNFSKGTSHNADHPKAKKFMEIFWGWAQEETAKK